MSYNNSYWSEILFEKEKAQGQKGKKIPKGRKKANRSI
jgi:hypothetical protein